MNASELTDLLEEADASLRPIVILIEGLEDYLRLNLRPASMVQVRELLEAYQRRSALLSTLARALSDTRDIINTLVSDGHPDLPRVEVTQEVLEDLQQNVDGLTGALAKFAFRQTPVAAQIVITGPGVVS